MPTFPNALRFDLVLSRAQPLSPGEHRSVADLGVRWSRRRWRHLDQLGVAALDGQGQDRAWLGFHYTEPDRSLAELPEVCRMLGQLARVVPESTPCIRDGAALFGVHEGQVVVARPELELPEPLPASWVLSEAACLALPPELSAPPTTLSQPGPGTDAELFDLLDQIERAGPRPALLRAGTAVALRHAVRLHALASSGVMAAAACHLLASLASRELAELSDAVPAAQHLVHTGDAREREAARSLLDALDASGVVSRTDPAVAWATEAASPAAWKRVRSLGVRLLSQPGLTGGDGLEAGTEDWEDDLDLDDLLLVLDEDAALPDTAVARAIGRLAGEAEVPDVRGLTILPAFPEHVLDLLRGKDSEAGAACLLLALGHWPVGRLPGLTEVLSGLARSLRPTVVRTLAVQALGRTGRPDIEGLLLELAQDDPAEVAGEALRSLARVPSARARVAIRQALDLPHLAAYAVDALAIAGDVGAFALAEGLAQSDQAEVRQALARHLDAIGGSRAERTLARLFDVDPVWEVRLEAASALTRLASPRDLSRLLDDPDADLRSRALRAVGRSRRGEAFGQVLAAADSVHAEVREAAALALGGLGLPGATPTLVRLATDAVESVAIAALGALVSCGDARALALARVMAARDDERGAAARLLLRDGTCLRLAPPEPRVRILARSTELLTALHQDRIRRAFEATQVRLSFHERGFSGVARLSTEDGDQLTAIAAAIDRADTEVHGLRWSVRDGQAALRRDRGAWLVSRDRGEVVRDAGWFEVPAPGSGARPPLAASYDEPLPAGAMPLPVAVQGDRPTQVEPAAPDAVEATEGVMAVPGLMGPRDHDTDDVRSHDLRTQTMLAELGPSPHLSGPLRDELEPDAGDGEEVTLGAWLEEVTSATDARAAKASATLVPPSDTLDEEPGA